MTVYDSKKRFVSEHVEKEVNGRWRMVPALVLTPGVYELRFPAGGRLDVIVEPAERSTGIPTAISGKG